MAEIVNLLARECTADMGGGGGGGCGGVRRYLHARCTHARTRRYAYEAGNLRERERERERETACGFMLLLAEAPAGTRQDPRPAELEGSRRATRPSGGWRFSARCRILGRECLGWCHPTGRCAYLPSVICYRQSIIPPPPSPVQHPFHLLFALCCPRIREWWDIYYRFT